MHSLNIAVASSASWAWRRGLSGSARYRSSRASALLQECGQPVVLAREEVNAFAHMHNLNIAVASSASWAWRCGPSGSARYRSSRASALLQETRPTCRSALAREEASTSVHMHNLNIAVASSGSWAWRRGLSGSARYRSSRASALLQECGQTVVPAREEGISSSAFAVNVLASSRPRLAPTNDSWR